MVGIGVRSITGCVSSITMVGLCNVGWLTIRTKRSLGCSASCPNTGFQTIFDGLHPVGRRRMMCTLQSAIRRRRMTQPAPAS